jgi:hypothetical protein
MRNDSRVIGPWERMFDEWAEKYKHKHMFTPVEEILFRDEVRATCVHRIRVCNNRLAIGCKDNNNKSIIGSDILRIEDKNDYLRGKIMAYQEIIGVVDAYEKRASEEYIW